LPSELLLCISDLIPPASAVALKLTSRRFFDLTPIKFKPRELDECAIKAISWSLDEFVESPIRYHCVLCNQLYPASLFSPLYKSGIELPERVCQWHVS
ncbi:hypothetical protein BJ546DRAFT_832883, partial [Cryomyces antarcticus]